MSADLLSAAQAAAAHAYAPYSKYPVGAALRDELGRVWSACNVENVSFGLSLCAERNAVTAMIAGGGREVKEIVVLTADAAPPCGACLQVLSEFAPDPRSLLVHLADSTGIKKTYNLHELLPVPFSSNF